MSDKASRKQDEVDLVREMQARCEINQQQRKGHQKSTTNNNSNNNDDDFESPYGAEGDSGRVSGGSQESAFISESDSDERGSQEGLDSTSSTSSSSDSSNSLSGRSSANGQSRLENIKVLNTHSNLVPEMTEALDLVDQVRLRFLNYLDEFESSVELNELYDGKDIEELRKPLPPVKEQEQSLAFRLISRYLNLSQLLMSSDAGGKANNKELGGAAARDKALNGALESLKELLKFRKHYELIQVSPDQFSKEFYLLSGIFPFGHDRQHLPVVYLRARVHRRWSTALDETFRRYVAWQIDRLTKSYHGAKVRKTIGLRGIEKDGSFGICFDCLHVSYSCLDMEFLRFLVRLLVNYYPTYCRYALCVDLPWLFRSVWKLVRSWLPEDAQNTVQLITSKQLTDYIDESQIPNSMKINDLKSSEKPANGKHQFPNDWESIKGIEELGKELNLNANEIKQFKSHAEKVSSEYKQLGAI